jgi:hypothetical protein
VAAQPHVIRRQRLGRVLLDQRGERVHVVVLESLDISGQEGVIGRVERSAGFPAADVAGLERGAGALERAV